MNAFAGLGEVNGDQAAFVQRDRPRRPSWLAVNGRRYYAAPLASAGISPGGVATSHLRPMLGLDAGQSGEYRVLEGSELPLGELVSLTGHEVEVLDPVGFGLAKLLGAMFRGSDEADGVAHLR